MQLYDVTRNYHIKWSKSEKESEITYDVAYVGSEKKDTNEFVSKTDRDSQT